MVGPVDTVEGGQVSTLYHIVGNAVVTVSAHDDAVIAGSAGLRDDVGADHVIVEGSVDQVHAGSDHSGELVGEVLHVHGGGGLCCGYLYAIAGAGSGEGVIQALGVHVCRAVDNAHLLAAGLLGIGGGDGALEAVGIAGTEDVVILGGQGVGGGSGRDKTNLFLIGRIRDGGGAAGGGGADHQAHALGYQGVKGVKALGGVALIVGGDDLHLTAQDAAGGVDFLHGQLNAGGDANTVGCQAAGVGRDGTDHNGFTAVGCCRCISGRGWGFALGAAAGSQTENQTQNQQNTEILFHFLSS